MKIVIVGPAYPYRGGIATFDEMLARTFSKRGDQVHIDTFTLQYPEFLFPGKTQYSESEAPEDIHIERRLSTVNPFSWIRLGMRLRSERPDMVIMKYWTPFMGPSLGTVARLARSNGHTQVIVQVDNVVPHEPKFTDWWFNRYFTRSVDGFVYMSGQVGAELKQLGVKSPSRFSPHPIFENYGTAIPREEALARTGLDGSCSYLLFFGLIRDYKGLDVLLEAWSSLKKSGKTAGRKLLVAGEFYADRDKYTALMERLGVREDVVLHDRFIKDEDVKDYFSVADVLVQPYKTATQSGVTQIAYNFNLPMIVTNVGGLSEIVADDVAGYVVAPDANSVAGAIERFNSDGNAARLRANMEQEKKRFSWDAMADAITETYAEARCSR